MSKILRNETRQDTWQRHLCVHSDVKRFEAPFTTAIMAEKRQELSQMTLSPFFSKAMRGIDLMRSYLQQYLLSYLYPKQYYRETH